MSRTELTYNYPIEIVARAVWLYFRFNLSLRDVEEMLLERGIAVSYETIRRWCRKHGPDYLTTTHLRGITESDLPTDAAYPRLQNPRACPAACNLFPGDRVTSA